MVTAAAHYRKADRTSGSLPNHFLLCRILVRQEATTYLSIEGTHSTLDAVLEAEEAGEERNADAGTGLVRDKEHAGHGRDRLFVARDVLRIFNRPFGDEPETPEI